MAKDSNGLVRLAAMTQSEIDRLKEADDRLRDEFHALGLGNVTFHLTDNATPFGGYDQLSGKEFQGRLRHGTRDGLAGDFNIPLAAGTFGASLLPGVAARGAMAAGAAGKGAAGEVAPSITKHGAERLTQRGFTASEIAATRGGRVLTQADGARVYVAEVAAGKFNIVVEGENGVITVLKTVSSKAVDRLSKKYGWR